MNKQELIPIGRRPTKLLGSFRLFLEALSGPESLLGDCQSIECDLGYEPTKGLGIHFW